MTREDIYDHLAQVYLGKRKEADHKKKKQFNAWLLINIVIAMIIFASSFYGLTAFLQQHRSTIKNNVIYALHNGPIRLEYNFEDPFPPDKTFSLSIAQVDATKYSRIQFTMRSKEEGTPGIVKVQFRNQKNEVAYYYIQGVGPHWKSYTIPLEDFKEITDWSTLSEISFVLESWNVEKKRGAVLIDDLSFSGSNNS